MPEIKVLKAAVADACKIGEIAYSVSDIHYRCTTKEFKKPTLKSQTEYIHKCISDKDILVLKAQIDKEIVGYVVVYFNTYPKAYFRYSKRAFIGSIGVAQSRYRQGMGRILLQAVENELKKRHISVVEVDYYTFNKAAEKLYKNLGYSEKKRLMTKFI